MLIPVVSYVFFGLFGGVSLVEIVLAFFEKEKARKIVKPFCLLSLTLAIAFFVPHHPLLYIGAIFGMIGDAFLVSTKPKFFIPGMIAFFIGHLFYISEILFILKLAQYLPWWFYVACVLFLLSISLAFYKLSLGIAKNKTIAILGNLYLGLLVIVTLIFILASVKQPGSYFYLGIIGGVSFLVSDLILTQATFVKDFKRRDFYIMTFYLIGQLLITLGIAFSIAA
ncbi:MAG: lysoplasmalogenase [Bacilli bacterium]|jgi:uncharacterized membrane protein YhhN|nr:lysoplasmalogenase [Erysipelotrichia bacterium]